jgi:SAM-dependent methyltransferase
MKQDGIVNRTELRRWAPVALVIAALTVGSLIAAQDVHPVTGRRIAPVMSHLGADWLDRPEREREEAPALAIESLDLEPGQTVADVGAGSGFFTERLSRAVGPKGRVFAVDIQPEMLERLRTRIERAGLANVTPVLATADDPRLPAGECDLILMVDVYHELSQPQRVLRQLKTALAPGGRLVLLEYRKEDPSIPIRPEHKMSVAEARAELEAEGFALDELIDVLPRQHILVFVPEQ